MSLSDWKANIERAQETKDAFFAQHWESPIPPQGLEVPLYAGEKDYHLPETG